MIVEQLGNRMPCTDFNMGCMQRPEITFQGGVTGGSLGCAHTHSGARRSVQTASQGYSLYTLQKSRVEMTERQEFHGGNNKT